jgi:hypothetical protein
MRAMLREKLTYANVVSTLCLILLVGGGSAYAVTQIDRNSVKSKHIVNEQVKVKDLAPDAVASPKIANGSLELPDIAQTVQSAVFQDYNFAPGECKYLDVASTAMADDAAALVLPDRESGTRVWDSRLVIEAYGPAAPDALEEMFAGPSTRVKLCNSSNDTIEGTDFAFYVLGFKGP